MASLTDEASATQVEGLALESQTGGGGYVSTVHAQGHMRLVLSDFGSRFIICQ